MKLSASSRLSNSSHRWSECKDFRVLVKSRVNHEKVQTSRCVTETIDKFEELSRAGPSQHNLQLRQSQTAQKPTQNSPVTQIKSDLRSYVKSMKKNPKQQEPQNNYTQRSRSSVCSRYSTRSQTKSQVGFQFNGNSTISLDDLELKLEEMIHTKLMKLAKSNPFPHSQKPPNELKCELDKLGNQIKQLKVLQERQEGEQEIKEDVRNLGRKITMLEKIIAESNTESDLMKRFYHHQRIQRKPSLVRKQNFTLYKSASILQKLTVSCLNDSSSDLNKNKKHIGYQTTSNLSYKKPAVKDYQSFKVRSPTFRVNRQPLPRSTYSCEYLTYGTMPKYRYNEDRTFVSAERCLGNHGSTYKHDYKEPRNKNGTNIDYKQLDCYQDKFRNVKVSFMQSSQKQPQILIKKHKHNQLKDNQASQPGKKTHNHSKSQMIGHQTNDKIGFTYTGFGMEKNQSDTMDKFMKSALLSQAKKEFVNKSSFRNKTQAKDKNLNFFRNTFKNMLRA